MTRERADAAAEVVGVTRPELRNGLLTDSAAQLDVDRAEAACAKERAERGAAC